ncbi:hypothetical protein K443DRAFT_15706 [Laccaria amethystina LaAM-08-1]|uniref:Zinc finger GRF-type domain-containing protein n=1 Tax=Laccaria amethystina LaAM-08-1 TaxID=1095629 RepID=A0A0C9WGR5_9AGAR|nr:hypothetical protein K443DRAFT_15706 [Laccaria amethystina LaAM-08-1]
MFAYLSLFLPSSLLPSASRLPQSGYPNPTKHHPFNANGNKGRLLAKCLHTDPDTGVKCSFFHWLAGSRTPSLSPCLNSASQLPAVGQPGGPASISVPDAVSQSTTALYTVAVPSYMVTVPPYMVAVPLPPTSIFPVHTTPQGPPNVVTSSMRVPQSTAAPSMVMAIFPVQTTPIAAPLSIPASFIEPNPPETRSQGPPNVVASSSRVPRNARIEPTFGSHMTELYTTQMAREERMQEERRRAKLLAWRANKRSSKRCLFMLGWRMALPPFLLRSKKVLSGPISF